MFCRSKNVGDNFVKLNLRKKVYARGKTGLKGAAYKRQQWKTKMSAKRGTACFKCGEEGHWANKCDRIPNKSQTEGEPHIGTSPCENKQYCLSEE